MTRMVVNGQVRVARDTTENWNSKPGIRPERGEIIVYEDYGKITDADGNEIFVPGIKIGDGNGYLIHLPFVGEADRDEILQQLKEHAENTEVHITNDERQFWNEKINLVVEETRLIGIRTHIKEEQEDG